MTRLWITEHDEILRGRPGDSSERLDGRVVLAPTHFDRLRDLDERLARTVGRQVFHWRARSAKSKQWVGLMQVRGLSIEVLPKIEKPGLKLEQRESFARKNLLTMLATTGDLPLRERDLADQATYSAPLLEALIRLFAERLFEELNRGVEHNYVRREENLHVLKGKLLFSEQVRNNAARRERLFVAHDVWLSDTPLNRVFKAACRRLTTIANSPRSIERLGYCLMLLDDVAELPSTHLDFDRILITRQNERFERLFNFCRVILAGETFASTTGASESFSLFFDMNLVFEAYVTAMFQRYVLRDDLRDHRCAPQARGRLRHLVYRAPVARPEDYAPSRHGAPTLALQADLLIEGPDRTTVIDTKWKELTGGSGRQGVGREDLYQLYAYATRYEAANSFLLYPLVDEVEPRDFHLEGGEEPQNIGVRFVDMRRDLHAQRADVVAELRAILA